MIDQTWMDALRVGHGSYNAAVYLGLLYQGWLGLAIRKRRKAGADRMPHVLRHRANGPVLVVLGILGYLAGCALAWIDRGRIFLFPGHAGTGLMIALCLVLTFGISRRIKGRESPWRTPHFILGIVILGLYLVQALLGLDILL